MSVIGVDASLALHGERAGLRHTRNLLAAMVDCGSGHAWRLLYFDRRGNTPGKIALPSRPGCAEFVSRLPIRLLLPAWRLVGQPSIECWLGTIDAVYAPDLYFAPARRAPVLCTVRGVAYLAIAHLCEPAKVQGLRRAFAYARRHAHHFLAVSQTTREDLLRYTDIPSRRIHVVTHGVDPVFRPLDKEGSREAVAARIGVRRPFLLYVGVIGRHKNVMGLLQAYANAGLAGQGVDLVLAGPFEPEILRARAFVQKERLDHAVHFPGPVGQHDDALTQLYNAALCLVHPSFYEGWGTTPLEAMACATPVIASDITSVREVVGDAAVTVAPDDTAALAMALRQIVTDQRLRTELATRGLIHAAQHTWQRSAQRLCQVLERVKTMGR